MISPEIITEVYDRFEGVTWYIQKMLNTLFMMTEKGGSCTGDMIQTALQNIISSYRYNYEETLFRLPEKQKEVLSLCQRGEGRRGYR